MKKAYPSYLVLLIVSVIFSAFWHSGANEEKKMEVPNLKVYVHPADIPDSGAANVFSDRISRLDFLFYYEGDSPIKDLKKWTFTLDLPRGVAVRSVALMSKWRKPGGKFYNFKEESVTHDGIEYTRYFLPLPDEAKNKINPELGGITGGISHSHAKVFLEPRAVVPDTFNAYWHAGNGNEDVSGVFPVKLFHSPYNMELPQRFVLMAESWGETSLYADIAEISSIVQLYKLIGISRVPVKLKINMGKSAMPEPWSAAGFKFYNNDEWGVFFAYSKEQREQSPNDNDYFIGLDGKRSKGGDWQKHHGRLFCPLSESTPGRFAFEKLKDRIILSIREGAKFFDLDLEIHFWNQCFCDDCLKQYSLFSKIPYEKLKAMKPADIVMENPDAWYRFRCSQTAELYRNLKKVVQKDYPDVKIGANDILVYPECDMGDLTWGVCNFGEDPRLIDDSVDYHQADTLMGCLADAVWVDAMRRNIKKPILAVAGSSYTTGFSHCNTVGRRYLAEKNGTATGYDIRGLFLKLNMVHLAASGAAGLRLTIEDDNGVIDAEVAAKAAEAADILAKTEAYYLDGRRADEDIEVIDMTAGESPYLKDKTTVLGGIWKNCYDLYGHVQYRVHKLGNDTVISLFNWDPYQVKQWLVRFKDAPGSGLSVCDLLNKKAYVIQNKNSTVWSKRELDEGILLDVPAGGMKIMRMAPALDNNINTIDIVSEKDRKECLIKTKGLKPADQYAWRKGKQFNMRENIIHEWKKRIIPYMEKGVIPDKFGSAKEIER